MDVLIDLVCKQTTYDREKARSKLYEFEFDPHKVIKDFVLHPTTTLATPLSPPPQTTVSAKSIQKQMFNQFRTSHNKFSKEYDEFKAKQEADVAERQRLQKEREADDDDDDSDDDLPQTNGSSGVVYLNYQPPRLK